MHSVSRSNPSQSLSPHPPQNQGQCLSVSQPDSIDFRNHSISFSSSHRLATKEKTHTLHTPQKKKIDFTRTPQKEKNTYLCSLHKTIQPLPRSYFFVSLFQNHVRWTDDIQLQPEMNASQKNVGSLQKVVVSRSKEEKNGRNKISANVETKQLPECLWNKEWIRETLHAGQFECWTLRIINFITLHLSNCTLYKVMKHFSQSHSHS